MGQHVQSDVAFPPQKKLDSSKSEKWMKQCIDSAEQIALYRNDRLRMDYKNKRANYMLMMNRVDGTDIQRITNPYGLSSESFPVNMQNYPIVMPRINVLIGEEIKRTFNWRVRVGNDDAINRKQEAIKEKMMALAVKYVEDTSKTKQEFEEEIKKLEKWKNYTHKDIRELESEHILRYMYQHLDMKTKFSKGFEDALIAGEEAFAIDVVGNDVEFTKLNPLKTFIVGKGDSPYFEDSDIIVIDDYIPIGAAIDKYHEFLTDKQIDFLEAGIQGDSARSSNQFISIGEKEASIIIDGDFNQSISNSESIAIDGQGNPLVNNGFNKFGEVRETKVYWKSRRKLLKLKLYDELGDEQLEYVDERYIPNEAKGESIDGHIWINEWYKGSRLSTDMYLNMGPREFQMRDMDNPSKCNPGIIGTVYNVNSNVAVSFLDMMKPYQYLYNTMMYRTELSIAKTHGKILRVDPSLIPDGMEMDEWMYYVTQMGIAIEDPFTEANQTGKANNLAQISRGAKDINVDNYQYIQQHVQMMQYLDEQCGRIAGVTMQREGQISTSATVGGTERAVMQSNNITEKYFSIHDNTKLRVLRAVLEACKYAWRGLGNKKLQYTTSDMANVIFDVDVEEFSTSNYDVFVSNSTGDDELMQALKQLAHAGVQNDKLNLSQIMDIYMSPSLSDVRRKIENAEEEKIQREQQELQANRDAQIKAAEIAAESEELKEQVKLDHESVEKQLDRDHEVAIEKIKQMGTIIKDARTNEPDNEKIKLQEDKQKHEMDKLKKEQDFKSAEAAKDRAVKRASVSK